jgi:predicted nucleic acid-binding protein
MKSYFDTAILIYALENGSVQARNLLEDSMRRGVVGISVVTIMEYCTGCMRHNRTDMVTRFRQFLRQCDFEIHLIQEETAFTAAKIRADYPAFKQMDALQLASAIVAEADVFYTNDKQLLQFAHERMKVVGFEESSKE